MKITKKVIEYQIVAVLWTAMGWIVTIPWIVEDLAKIITSPEMISELQPFQ